MSINTAHAQGGVLIFAGERILLYCDDVEIGFDGGNLPEFKGHKKGRMYLTTHRAIFNARNSNEVLQSFSMPFYCMREIELEQPVFGSNYIKGKIMSEQGGKWQGVVKIKMWFTAGGAIEFGQAMLRAGQLASRYQAQQPPPYTPPQGPVYQAPPPMYTPQYGNYGWVPFGAFPTAPPAEQVYMTESPPPYPGIEPTAPPPPTNGYPPQSGADAKAQEAAGSAYYNPSAPHNVYMPQQQQYGGYGAPPSYSDVVNKKNQ